MVTLLSESVQGSVDSWGPKGMKPRLGAKLPGCGETHPRVGHPRDMRASLLPLVLFLNSCGAKHVADDPIWLLDRYDGPSFSELLEVEVMGEHVAFCSGVLGLNVYDASNPSRLRLASRVTPSLANARYPRCQRLAVDVERSWIAVAAHSDEIQPVPWLALVDASDPDDAREVAVTLPGVEVEGLAFAGERLYVAAHEDGVVVYDVGPDSIVEAERFSGLTNAWTVVPLAEHLVVADGQGGVAVLELSDGTEVARIELPGPAKDLALDGDRLYVALGVGGVAAIDVTEPQSPSLIEVAETPGSAVAVATGAGALYVADWNDLRVFDATGPNLEVVGKEPLALSGTTESRSLGIAARGEFIFSSNWTELVAYEYRPGVFAGDLGVGPRPLDLPSADAGETTVAVLRLTNEGNAPLALDAIDASRNLEVQEIPDALEPGEEAWLEVSWQSDGQPWSGSLTVRSDDPDQDALRVDVRANTRGLAVGDSLPDDWVFSTLTGAQFDLAAQRSGLQLLAYFSTF